MKKKQILSIVVGLVILSCTLLGTFQFHKSINCALSLLKTTFVYPSIAILEVNDFIKDVSSAEDKAETLPINKKEQSNKTLKLLFLILSTMLVSNEKFFLILLIMVFAGICIEFKKTFDFDKDNRILTPPEIKFYLWWSLKFLTPLQKCILNRSDEYDINPIIVCEGKKNPHFVNEQNAGFFYVYENENYKSPSFPLFQRGMKEDLPFSKGGRRGIKGEIGGFGIATSPMDSRNDKRGIFK